LVPKRGWEGKNLPRERREVPSITSIPDQRDQPNRREKGDDEGP